MKVGQKNAINLIYSQPYIPVENVKLTDVNKRKHSNSIDKTKIKTSNVTKSEISIFSNY